MGVAVDERRQDDPPAEIDPHGAGRGSGADVPAGADRDDPAVADEHPVAGRPLARDPADRATGQRDIGARSGWA
jgi:hypothetical protein